MSGFGTVSDAVRKFMHDLETKALLSKVHVNGVIRLGNIGNTIMRYEVVNIGLDSSKLNMMLAGAD